MFSLSRGTGTPLLALHGFPLTHHSLLPLDAVFASVGSWRRIYVDLPGLGESAGSSDVDGYQAVLDAVKRFVDDEIGAEPFAIFGYSFGGILARSLAQEFGEQVLGLGFLAPVIIDDPAQSVFPERRTLVTEPGLLERLSAADRKTYTATSVVETTENWEAFARFILPALAEIDEPTLARITSSTDLRGIPEPEGYVFDRPAVFLHGRQDDMAGYVDAFHVLDHYPRATYAVLDRAGHNLHLDHPDLVESLVRDWLLRTDEARTATPPRSRSKRA